jgi:ribosomal-protein-alanine N-acetyltransferase
LGGAIRAVIETPRLALREMTLADLDFVAGMLADSRVMRFYPKTYSREESEEWVLRQMSRYRNQGFGLWLAVDSRNETPVGQVGLVRQEVDGAFEDEIGYLLDASCWGRGLATEAARATRDHAFEALGKERVISLIRPENVPSQGVANRVGLRPGRRTLFAGLEHIVFSLDRAGWRGLIAKGL